MVTTVTTSECSLRHYPMFFATAPRRRPRSRRAKSPAGIDPDRADGRTPAATGAGVEAEIGEVVVQIGVAFAINSSRKPLLASRSPELQAKKSRSGWGGTKDSIIAMDQGGSNIASGGC